MNTQPVPIKNRRRLFLGTYLIGVMVFVAFFLLDVHSQPALLLDSSGEMTPRVITIGEFLFDSLFSIVLLPWGFVAALQWLLEHLSGIQTNLIEYMGAYPSLFLPENVFGTLLIGISYVLLFVLPIAGSRTKNQRTFRILYFSFLGWILMNIGGCLSYSF